MVGVPWDFWTINSMITSSSLELTIYNNIQQYTTKESSLIITVFVWPNLFPLVFRGPAGFFFRKMATDSPLKLQNWPSMCSWTSIGKTSRFHPMLSSHTQETPNMNLKHLPISEQNSGHGSFCWLSQKFTHSTRHMFFSSWPSLAASC